MNILKHVYKHFLDFFIPPSCLVCGVTVAEDGLVCSSCFRQFHFIHAPFCHACSLPFISDAEAGIDSICSDCKMDMPLWQACRAAFVYNEGIKRLIVPLKHGDRHHSICFLTRFMARQSASLFAHVDYIVPVPLHKRRLRQRKYNQSALLARQLGKYFRTSVLPMGLLRVRETIALGHLNRQERYSVLDGAFEVNPLYSYVFKNKNILLVDDVVTTGATLTHCSRALYDAGAARVDVVAVAKVV
ncbi:double zinc ribbon domain-containing protein [Commensalibacter oyaizuii]|uniref:Double zinc ribbon domain-containing protein n=1 Tax=Commensalibacter oyaizuii TaxID=3043873 RepID=A0ABT6Q122_9PROT|nr:double zinc ribbon domain-containing protein [Commensalibacter sp. TBRC 16381]MDI2090817.1 double zinc ribbon domain-containing protein [Commensalibacter sp. TBRC 16381]